MIRHNDLKTKILSIVKEVGKVNRVSGRYEFMIHELSLHKSVRLIRHDKLMSALDSLISSYAIKLIGNNKYSCDAKALECLNEN